MKISSKPMEMWVERSEPEADVGVIYIEVGVIEMEEMTKEEKL